MNKHSELPKFQQIQYEFAKNLRNPAKSKAPEGIEARRMKVYQDLFYNNIQNFCANSFPILRSLTPDDKWHSMVRSFFTDYRAHSPYFADISGEFLNYLAEARQPEQDDFPFMTELAHWEWMEVSLLANKLDILAIPHDRNGDLFEQKIVISPLAVANAYEFPVHRIGKAYIPEDKPEQPTFLIICRDRKHKIEFMETNLFTFRLLQIFLEHLEQDRQITGQQALQQLAEETQFPNPQQLIEGGKQMLDSLLQRDVILGVNS